MSSFHPSTRVGLDYTKSTLTEGINNSTMMLFGVAQPLEL